jgi:hypothetical protein
MGIWFPRTANSGGVLRAKTQSRQRFISVIIPAMPLIEKIVSGGQTTSKQSGPTNR